MMRCSQCLPLLPEYLDRELTQEKREDVATHLIRCETCRRALARLRHVEDLTRAAKTVPGPPAEYWDDLAARVEARVSGMPKPAPMPVPEPAPKPIHAPVEKPARPAPVPVAGPSLRDTVREWLTPGRAGVLGSALATAVLVGAFFAWQSGRDEAPAGAPAITMQAEREAEIPPVAAIADSPVAEAPDLAQVAEPPALALQAGPRSQAIDGGDVAEDEIDESSEPPQLVLGAGSAAATRNANASRTDVGRKRAAAPVETVASTKLARGGEGTVAAYQAEREQAFRATLAAPADSAPDLVARSLRAQETRLRRELASSSQASQPVRVVQLADVLYRLASRTRDPRDVNRALLYWRPEFDGIAAVIGDSTARARVSRLEQILKAPADTSRGER